MTQMPTAPAIEIRIFTRALKHLSTVCKTFDKFGKMRSGSNHANPAETAHVPSQAYVTEERYFGRIVKFFADKASSF